ncbi:hypothetical protein GGR06_001669 [Bacteroides reticulotermitis]|uniref:Uncharacterized protein n=2 Tax=Bacteroides reticulotermitis TaxID=1133319 RepID=W4UQD4_9BACE|nr:hypothetical protein [Bacteroides reticulotermitis]GAE83390.1 hypothetical protein JCM10512_1660 [Bacteroides reticulotermitis JCM 10512]
MEHTDYFIEVKKETINDVFFIDLREISHISYNRHVTIYFKNGMKDDFKNINYEDIKKALIALSLK